MTNICMTNVTINSINHKIPNIIFPDGHVSVIKPSKENFVKLNDYMACDSQYHHWKEINGKPLPGSLKEIYVRKSVFQKLLQVQSNLPRGYELLIYDGYRDITVQEALWAHYRAIIASKHKSMSDSEIDRLTGFCVTKPSHDITRPSLHNTGGAVDLTLMLDSRPIDMGTDFDDFHEKAWTNYYEIHPVKEITENRRLLYHVMTGCGFTNLPSEWWHYDYGDEKWALLNNTQPFYEGILHADQLTLTSK